MPSTPITTAIIGAGIAGLACARLLQDADLPVTLFDKGRGPGGRMSSRHLPGAVVDLGAQFFSVRDHAFRQQVSKWQHAGCVAPWPASLWQADDAGWQPHHDTLERFVGTPRMSSVARYLARDINLASGTRIERLDRDAERWRLVDTQGERHGPFDRVVIAAPSPQAQALVAPHDSTLAEDCEAVIQRPCWAAWARFEAPLPAFPGVADDWQAVRLPSGPLRFVSRNDHKPGRGSQGESLSLLAHLAWSEANLEAEPDAIADRLLAAFRDALPSGSHLPAPSSLGAHRWRYAQPDVFARGEAVNRDYRLLSNGLALCGDGWRGPRVEDAWLSGRHLGEALRDASRSSSDTPSWQADPP